MVRWCISVMFVTAASQLAVAQEVTYRKDIHPLWEARCSSCHGVDAPYYGDFREDKDRYVDEELGPRMDTYADLLFFVGWPDSGALMRRLDDGRNHPQGEPGNMYEYLGEDDAERKKNLQVFKAWVGESAWNLKRWKARGDQPGITKEELEQLKVAY